MGPKKGGKKGKGKGKKKDEGPLGPTLEELLAQIATLNAAKDKETQERNLMMLERVGSFLLFIQPSFNCQSNNYLNMVIYNGFLLF